MTGIVIVRQQPVALSEDERATLRRVLFGIVDGLGQKGKSQWRRLWNRILNLEPGEMMELKTHQARLGWYHRKHMLLEQTVFEAQERFDNFEQFRLWLKVGAGFVLWVPGPKGGVIPVPKSISYATLEQGDMEQFHADVVNFLLTDHAQKTLWKHLTPAARGEMVDTLLARMGEFQ